MRAVLLAALLVAATNAAYFRLHDTQPLCFAEEIGYGSEIVAVEWFRRHLSTTKDIHVTVTVVSPTSRAVIYTNKLKDAAGTFTFKPMAGEVGEYDVCFAASGIDQAAGRYVEVGVAIDHHDRKNRLPHVDPMVTRQKVGNEEVFTFTDYDGNQKDTLRTHDYLQHVNLQIATAHYTANEIHEEVKWFYLRQQRMRMTSESTFERVWMMSIVTLVVVIASSWVQFAYLKKFLKRKKLV